MSRKLVVSLLIVSVFMFAGLVQAENTIDVAQVADISTLDPQAANDIYSANVMKQIYNNLVVIDSNMDIQGDLATSWENPDELTWIFNLEEGVMFHNGNEFTAEDVKFTIERLLDPETGSPGAWLLEEVEEVEVVDDYTVKIVTGEPFAPLLSNLARYEVSMLNKEAVEAAGEDYSSQPVGTGPFVFEEHQYGDKVILSTFADYFRGAASTDGIVYRAIPEDATRVIELESGGLDIMYNLPPQEANRLDENEDLDIIKTLGQSTLYAGFNVEVEPLGNRKVRQALNYAVDKTAIVEAVFFGMAEPSYGPLSPSIWGFDKELSHAYPYDPDKAMELLEEAGYADGFDLTIWTDPRTERSSIAELIQAYLAPLGINAEVELMEWSNFISASRDSDGLFILGWTGTGDADGGLYSRFHSTNIGASNRHRWATDEMDAMLEAGRTTVDVEERAEVYKELQRYIIDAASDIFIAVPETLAAKTDNVEGFTLYPNNINPLYSVEIVD
ncbi:MAG: ABC transporter substrate-binding protein [Bacillota bacterium]